MNYLIYMGAGVALAGGFLLTAVLLAATSLLAGVAGQWLFNRMRRIYQIVTIFYWLGQMQKRGTHCFPKPTEESP